MVMMLTKAEVEHLASLAKIELTSREKEQFAGEISQILDYVRRLGELDLGSEDLAFEESEAGLREDRVFGWSSHDQESLIKQAPDSQDNLIKTKPVFK
ncbi:MAG: Asp-tRNA(Asn)/Glu-tRNA(Gln) amidotransferase GatCAB subunit C [Candidatus Komeilibacteria bacterium CG10_big_fil_rev_8_21_14_0_10_41_13]|uniref:Aspartyl/glutamyl-tRNA(Asn/Gln) amidotransferase subunit C n=1 Tax=Candidatus Komeilibacteria bacterium CG10_big_fil_rev_8_21_14_0_10_41_13 TaxID=1974476 RepID=A0A2M6WBS6_9BACT|nr:MAG: Asp-tRNA(Asn)/Glu-tRNA(Gln) amidotransferase GatCAB subunit C [Candidatus Komeilibacteria bacterium CG10_big_fil_rev_8_21_14_0_10_41_13]